MATVYNYSRDVSIAVVGVCSVCLSAT